MLCNLFTGIMTDWKENVHMKAIAAILTKVGKRVEGNLICDVQPSNWVYHTTSEKIHNLQQLAKGQSHIVEIGVNACHSLVLMLLVNPNAEYLLFDLYHHAYTEPTLAYVRSVFPSTKITLVPGDSRQTLPSYLQQHPEVGQRIGFCHLDGGHTESVFSADYQNIQPYLSKEGQVLFDDLDMPTIRAFLQKKIREGEIVPQNPVGWAPTEKHLLYRYQKQ